MDLIAKLLPQFVNDLPPTGRKFLYGALVIVAALLLADFHFAADSGVPWLATHVVSASVLAWYTLVVSPVLLMAHQNVALPDWERQLADAVLPELMSTPAPHADMPNAAAETATSVPPAVATDPTTPPATEA